VGKTRFDLTEIVEKILGFFLKSCFLIFSLRYNISSVNQWYNFMKKSEIELGAFLTIGYY